MSYIIELDTGAVKEQHVIESYVAVTDFMSVYIMPLLWRKKILVIRIEDNTFITKNVDFIKRSVKPIHRFSVDWM